MQYLYPTDIPCTPRPTRATEHIARANIYSPAPRQLISPRILSLHIHAALRSARTRSCAHAYTVTVYQWADLRMLSRQISTPPNVSTAECLAFMAHPPPPAGRPIYRRTWPCASSALISLFAVYCIPRAHRHVPSSHRPPRLHRHSALDRPYVKG